MNQIRKISIGHDLKAAMHYVHGQDVLNGTHKVHHLHEDEKGNVYVWIENKSSEVTLWKKFNSQMPITIEYNIDF